MTDEGLYEFEYGDCESSGLLHDENGFPSFQDNDDDDDDEEEEEEKEESFADDFYRCGTDWSCLLQTERKLKQANLFDMWGLKSNSESEANCLFSPPMKKLKASNGKSKATHLKKIADRSCPFYKKIPGTPFTVDAFRYGSIKGCSAYFLTHFHYDHYGGLGKRWSHGPIYCSPLTARLVRMCLLVNPSYIHPLELNTEHVIDGVKVTLLEANHCPGAALIHFRLQDGQCYLHTGDFRASRLMQSYPLLVNHRVNVLYLDTTYCNPKYKFPSKEDVLNYVVRVTKNCLKKQPKTLVVVGAYSIGKESVFLAISKALGVKIYANASRRRVLQSFDWPELSGNLCTQGNDTLLHVLPMSSLKFETLKDYLKPYGNQYAAVLAFRPTGWTYSETVGNQLDLIRPLSRGNITIYGEMIMDLLHAHLLAGKISKARINIFSGVPYSEHSSFTELREFVQFLRPDKIIPTVNVWNAASREKMQSFFREWLSRKKLMI
ncbi:hypothetical protein WN943_010347 [Citrus x changshan-huyou]